MALGSFPLCLLAKNKARELRRASAATPPMTPPAIAPVRDLGLPPPPPPPPELVVEEGFGIVLVLRLDMPEPLLCNEVELESATVGGVVGVASGSLPAAWASVRLNPGLVSFKKAQWGTDALKGMGSGYLSRMISMSPRAEARKPVHETDWVT